MSAVVVVATAGCGQAGPGTPAGSPEAQFDQRAAEVAAAWGSGDIAETWRTGFVPLQELTVVPAGMALTEAAKQALQAGWFRLGAPLPDTPGGTGEVRFADGRTLPVPLVGAAEAYRGIDQGDPQCPPPGAPVTPPPSPGPDAASGQNQPGGCVALTVTGAKLGTVALRTSRGPADVPAWQFTVAELPAPLARVAVAPSAVAEPPAPVGPAPGHLPGLVSGQDLTRIDGAKVEYQLGVGACDTDIRPLVYETDRVVVVGGAVRTGDGPCIEILKLHPVVVTLDAPLGNRPVVDALTGRPLPLRP